MENKHIVLGVCGGIAAYKACDLASRLTQMRARIDVVMTESAQKFVAPLTFQALTQRAVHTSLWPASHDESGVAAAMAHIELAACDAILVAPATANCIARLAHGFADDLLTTLVLASRAPVLIAPAMNPQMLAHTATQRNLAQLGELGYHIIEPEFGRMACEHVGAGRLPTTDALVAALESVFAPRDWESVKVLITAGPTRENIDPVRYISNRSSGKMGFALAEECARRGANVNLVCGPVNLPTPRDVNRINVTTTAEMFAAATRQATNSDVVIAAAAPADYSVDAAPQKLKKSTVEIDRTLRLRETPDILGAMGKARRDGQILIGFAAETENLLENARAKLARKNCDAIVANDVTQSGAGFDIETNIVTWIARDGEEAWPQMRKTEVAARICDKIGQLRAA